MNAPAGLFRQKAPYLHSMYYLLSLRRIIYREPQPIERVFSAGSIRLNSGRTGRERLLNCEMECCRETRAITDERAPGRTQSKFDDCRFRRRRARDHEFPVFLSRSLCLPCSCATPAWLRNFIWQLFIIDAVRCVSGASVIYLDVPLELAFICEKRRRACVYIGATFQWGRTLLRRNSSGQWRITN